MPAVINVAEQQKTYIKAGASRALITAGWDDIPHLDENTQRELLEETPPWLRDARSKGIPSMGAGAIYPISEASIKVDPFAIPPHWRRAYAMDVGWNWTAALWGAWDLDTNTLYIFGEYKAGQLLPQVHADAIKGRGAWMRGVIDPAADGRNQHDGQKLMESYIASDLELQKAFNGVDAGLQTCWLDLSVGRIKVFSTLQSFFGEYRLYRRDEKGNIVKKNDHLMDCMRYLRMSGLEVARTKASVDAGLENMPAVKMPGIAGY